jgi:O-antigen ligase
MNVGPATQIDTPGNRVAFFASALTLVMLALVLGGASQGNPLGLMVVELAGVAALIPSLLQMPKRTFSPFALVAFAILVGLMAIPMLQLAPLPPGLWRVLPGRAPLVQAVTLIGLPDQWRPMSLAPDQTERAALYLLAPVGMFLAAVQCDGRQRAWLASAVLAISLLSLAAGAVQVAGGSAERLKFYSNSATGLPTGFFANRNHQAALMICALVLTPGLCQAWPSSLSQRPSIALIPMLLFAVGAAATLSRAGLLMLAPALVAAVAILQAPQAGQNAGVQNRALLLTLMLSIGGGAAVVALKGGAIFDRFENGEAGGGRLSLLPRVIALGKTLQPWGGGVGSFDLAYRAVEPLQQIDPFYLNHVHNDYIEAWLEAGWPALALFIGFGLWWIRSTIRAWRSRGALACSGTLMTAALLLHSAVDYPLRTPALAVVFALGCALMTPPPRGKTSRRAE